MEQSYNNEVTIIRKGYYADKIVFVDGLWGCGKTMISPIISAFDRVELLTYAYEIEYMCALSYLKKIPDDSSATMIRMLTDLQLYNLMMSREINFRPSDLSSVFKNSEPERYFQRLFQKGDENIPDKITSMKPILSFTTHNLLGFSKPIFSALQDRVVFIEVVRHPLYMIKQISLNMEKLIGDVRDFTILFSYKNKQLPYYIYGWEELFLIANSVDKAIYYLDELTKITENRKRDLIYQFDNQIITIPFELFVTNPEPYIIEIEQLLETKATHLTHEMMRRQNVPRSKYSEGIDLEIYRRCGWEPHKLGLTENEEFQLRRNLVSKDASSEGMKVLDKLCANYEEKYMGGKIIKEDHYE